MVCMPLTSSIQIAFMVPSCLVSSFTASVPFLATYAGLPSRKERLESISRMLGVFVFVVMLFFIGVLLFFGFWWGMLVGFLFLCERGWLVMSVVSTVGAVGVVRALRALRDGERVGWFNVLSDNVIE